MDHVENIAFMVPVLLHVDLLLQKHVYHDSSYEQLLLFCSSIPAFSRFVTVFSGGHAWPSTFFISETVQYI
jgi:hypothetical protein